MTKAQENNFQPAIASRKVFRDGYAQADLWADNPDHELSDEGLNP
jgi:hypothetical protein